MKHVHLTGFGDPSVLTIKESPIPVYTYINLLLTLKKPKENEVLIKTKVSGLNRADTTQREGHYPLPPGASEILGLEAAGYLCNPDGSYDESKRVMALLSGGGCAEYFVVPKEHVMDIPKNLSLEEAGGLPENWITAFLLLDLAGIKEGDKVLIYAGASGVGTAATQLVKMFKGTSIVTVSTDDKIEYSKKVGADFAINYKKEQNLSKAVLDATEGKGVDIILDCVGPSFFNLVKNYLEKTKRTYVIKGFEVAAVDARWIVYGLLSGTQAPNFNFGTLMWKRISIIASTLRARSKDFKTSLIEKFKKTVLPHFETGEFKIFIDQMVKVDWTNVKPIQEAHKSLESNQNAGKVIFSFQ